MCEFELCKRYKLANLSELCKRYKLANLSVRHVHLLPSTQHMGVVDGAEML